MVIEVRYVVLYEVWWTDESFEALLKLGFPEFYEKWSRWVESGLTGPKADLYMERCRQNLSMDAEFAGIPVKGRFKIRELSRHWQALTPEP